MSYKELIKSSRACRKNNYALVSYLVCFHQKSQFITNYLTTSKGKMSQKLAKIWPPARIQGQKLSWPGIKRNEDRIPPPGKVIVFRKSKSRWSDPLLSSLTVSHFQEKIILTGLSPPSPQMQI